MVQIFVLQHFLLKKKHEAIHNEPVVPVSLLVISSWLISSVFKQFEIIVTFNPTKTKDKLPRRINIMRKAKPVLHFAIHPCMQFNFCFDRIFCDFPSLYNISSRFTLHLYLWKRTNIRIPEMYCKYSCISFHIGKKTCLYKLFTLFHFSVSNLLLWNMKRRNCKSCFSFCNTKDDIALKEKEV